MAELSFSSWFTLEKNYVSYKNVPYTMFLLSTFCFKMNWKKINNSSIKIGQKISCIKEKIRL